MKKSLGKTISEFLKKKKSYTKGKKEKEIKVPGQHEKVMSGILQSMQYHMLIFPKYT